MILPPVVIWVDPGKMTGLASWAQPGLGFTGGEYPFQQAGQIIEEACQAARDYLWIGWERYTIDTRRPQQNAADAIEVIGLCRYMATRHGCRILPAAQQASPSKAEQAALRALGWWLPGMDDAQSAAAHLLRWMLATNSAPPKVRDVLIETARSGNALPDPSADALVSPAEAAVRDDHPGGHPVPGQRELQGRGQRPARLPVLQTARRHAGPGRLPGAEDPGPPQGRPGLAGQAAPVRGGVNCQQSATPEEMIGMPENDSAQRYGERVSGDGVG